MVFGGKGGSRPQPDLRPSFVGNGRPQGQTATQPELQSEPTQAQIHSLLYCRLCHVLGYRHPWAQAVGLLLKGPNCSKFTNPLALGHISTIKEKQAERLIFPKYNLSFQVTWMWSWFDQRMEFRWGNTDAKISSSLWYPFFFYTFSWLMCGLRKCQCSSSFCLSFG